MINRSYRTDISKHFMYYTNHTACVILQYQGNNNSGAYAGFLKGEAQHKFWGDFGYTYTCREQRSVVRGFGGMPPPPSPRKFLKMVQFRAF